MKKKEIIEELKKKITKPLCIGELSIRNPRFKNVTAQYLEYSSKDGIFILTACETIMWLVNLETFKKKDLEWILRRAER